MPTFAAWLMTQLKVAIESVAPSLYIVYGKQDQVLGFDVHSVPTVFKNVVNEYAPTGKLLGTSVLVGEEPMTEVGVVPPTPTTPTPDEAGAAFEPAPWLLWELDDLLQCCQLKDLKFNANRVLVTVELRDGDCHDNRNNDSKQYSSKYYKPLPSTFSRKEVARPHAIEA